MEPIENTNYNLDKVNAECCCFNMRKVMRAVTQFFDKRLEKTGIRATQFNLLVALSSTTGRTLTEIADGLVMDRTTLTRNLKPLEKMELIKIVETTDKRAKAYMLTDKGHELLQKCYPIWKSAQDIMLSAFADDDYEKLLHEVHKLLKAANSGL